MFFTSQCTLSPNSKASKVLPDIRLQTNTRLNSFSITEKDMIAIIKSLDAKKSHRYDNIGPKMAKIEWRIIDITLKLSFRQL